MKIRPILFSTPMVEAILNGRKTQTRRIIKPHPEWKEPFWLYGGTIWHINNIPNTSGQGFQQNMKIKQGDILWVRETFCEAGNFASEQLANSEVIAYKTREAFFYNNGRKLDTEFWNWDKLKWKPSIFMPKAVCRLFLEVTNVRVERLRDISEEDANSEGIYAKPGSVSGAVWYEKFIKAREARIEGLFTESAKECFQTLWQSINGKESWEANPFVFVYNFKQVERPTNFLL